MIVDKTEKTQAEEKFLKKQLIIVAKKYSVLVDSKVDKFLEKLILKIESKKERC